MSRYPNKLSKELIRRNVLKQDAEDCWDWIGSLQTSGYGQIKIDGKNWTAHRASWVAHNGPIHDDLQVLHHCDNTKCCNPEHLYLGHRSDNMKDMIRRGRRKQHGKVPK